MRLESDTESTTMPAYPQNSTNLQLVERPQTGSKQAPNPLARAFKDTVQRDGSG
jgi:hypothetical protein